MQLDTHARVFLEMVAASGQPKLWDLTPDDARKKVIELTRIVEGKEAIGKMEDRTLPGPAGPLPFRIYTPLAANDQSSAGVIFFHGGAWVLGDLDTHDCLCRILANESGCRLVSVDYRLAPEHPFPAAVEDACAATAWIAAHAAELAVDPSCLAVAGDSAGGALAAVVCQSAKGFGFKIALQVLLCPVTDIAADNQSRRQFAEGYFLEGPLMSWAGTHYLASGVDINDPRLSPLRALDLSGLPPALIHTAGFDLLRDEGKAYADALECAGVKVHHVCHEHMIHHFYAMAGAIPYARTALKAVGADIKAALSPVGESALESAPQCSGSRPRPSAPGSMPTRSPDHDQPGRRHGFAGQRAS
jgi:acetyl esterase